MFKKLDPVHLSLRDPLQAQPVRNKGLQFLVMQLKIEDLAFFLGNAFLVC